MSAAPALEYWFDFSSPYGYFGSTEIENIAHRHGQQVLWRPFMLGVAFRATGMSSLSKTPLRGDYARRDWSRMARRANIPFAPPAGHSITALPATRMFYWIETRDRQCAAAFAKAVFKAYFAEGQDLTSVTNVASLGSAFGMDPAELTRGASDPEIKDFVRRVTDEALARGVFGSPFTIVDGEPFWGADRLPMVDEWLRCGGW